MTRVLIVDDEPDILLMLRVNLEADGFDTALAPDGQTALKRLDQEPFDVVLLDIMMPVLDGWVVLQSLGEREASPRTIVVSARSSPRDVTRALELGAAAYVTKPFSPVELSELIVRVLALSNEELAAERQASLSKIRAES